MTTVGLALEDSWTEASRHLRIVPRNIELLLFSTIQPIMFVVLFVYVFGGSIQVDGYENYYQFLLPGIFSQTMVFNSAFTGVGLAEDLQKGLIDRLRSLPMARSAVLIGRTVSDLVRNMFTFFVMLGVAFLIGFRFEGSLAEAVVGDAPAAALQLLPELGAGADRALGEVGRGRQLGRVHLDVPDDVRVVGVRRPEHDARLARADRRREPVHEGDERGAGALQRPRPGQRRVVDAWGGRSA